MTDNHASSELAALWSSRLLVMLVLGAGAVAGLVVSSVEAASPESSRVD